MSARISSEYISMLMCSACRGREAVPRRGPTPGLVVAPHQADKRTRGTKSTGQISTDPKQHNRNTVQGTWRVGDFVAGRVCSADARMREGKVQRQ